MAGNYPLDSFMLQSTISRKVKTSNVRDAVPFLFCVRTEGTRMIANFKRSLSGDHPKFGSWVGESSQNRSMNLVSNRTYYPDTWNVVMPNDMRWLVSTLLAPLDGFLGVALCHFVAHVFLGPHRELMLPAWPKPSGSVWCSSCWRCWQICLGWSMAV